MTGSALLPNLSSLVSCETHRWNALMPSLISGIDRSTGPIKTLRVDLGSIRDTRCVDFVASLGNTNAASTLEMLTLIPTGFDDDYWMPPGGEHLGHLASPPQLFSVLSALSLLVIEKPIRGPEDEVFIEELGETILPAEPKYDSIWSHAQAKESWRVNCPKLTSVCIYGKRLNLRA
ncbi:unnamed protein product [Rhizoctonia solani]|nr:unnamed protein product [Rhizoctonia solani]